MTDRDADLGLLTADDPRMMNRRRNLWRLRPRRERRAIARQVYKEGLPVVEVTYERDGDAASVAVVGYDGHVHGFIGGNHIWSYRGVFKVVLPAFTVEGPPCPRCGEPMYLVSTPDSPSGRDWGHDCLP